MNRRSLTAAGAALAAALGTVPAVALAQDGGHAGAAPAAAARKAPAQPGDFDGDGRRDSASASPQGKIDGRNTAGFVTVVHSRPKGPDAASRQLITAKGLGLPLRHYFGGTDLQSADFDRDGYADLVTQHGNASKTQVVIVYGGAAGLTTRKVVLDLAGAGEFVTGDFNGNGAPDLVVRAGSTAYWTFMDPGAKPVKGVRTVIGGAGVTGLLQPAAGDFNGDGKDDFAVVAARDSGDGDDLPNWGEVRLGTAKGLGARKVYAERGSKGMGLNGAGTGDVNGDGRDDLVVIDPFAPKRVTVRLGTATGPGPAKLVGLGDRQFGDRVSVGDVNGDGKADVAVGYALDELASNGGVGVLYGSGGGLTNKGAQLFDQKTPGVPSEPGDHDGFGWDVRLADLDGDGSAELTTGAQNNGSSDASAEGRLFFFKGTRSGVTVKGIVSFGTRDLRIYGRHAELGGNLLH